MSKAGRLTIETMPINMQKLLTNDDKNRLEKILNDEFLNQTTILNADINSAEEKIIEQWKKKKNWEDKLEALQKARAEEDRLDKALKATGLDEHGTIIRSSGYGGSEEGFKEGRKIQEEIDKATKALRQPRNVKNKIIFRLRCAETVGQACVIMNEVLGNGLIPTVDNIKMIEAPKA